MPALHKVQVALGCFGRSAAPFMLLAATVSSALLSACDTHEAATRAPRQGQESDRPGWVDRERLLRTEAEPHQWMTSGGNFKQQHYSPLQQITSENVHRLGFAWQYHVNPNRGRVLHGMQATPQVIDGVMYTSGPWGTVFAVDAETGKQLWRYDPEVDGNFARNNPCCATNRGVAVWKGRIYVGTLDGFLVALDAASGKELWKVDTFIDRKRQYAINSSPEVAGDNIVIGNAGAELGVRGYISAYNYETGKLAWRFYTIPGDPAKGYEHPEMEVAAKTWSRNSRWEAGGGGTVWGEMTYDPELNLLYVGSGNGGPYPVWWRSPGGGDNLYLASILAINPDNGRLVWHYQSTPGDSWDYPNNANMVLAELEIGGRSRNVLMQAPKNGFFYVLDRATGELLSAKNFVRINWASHVDLKTGRPVLTGQADYRKGPKVVMPSILGGHNWQPMSYSSITKLVYIPTLEMAMAIKMEENFRYDPTGVNNGVDMAFPPFASEVAATGKRWQPAGFGNAAKGFEHEVLQEALKAWNPITQEEVWRVPLDGVMNGGTLVTAGNVVFQGNSSGHFVAYDALTGRILKDIDVGTGIIAGPMSFAIDSVQYVAVMVGWGDVFSNRLPPNSPAYRYQNLGRIIAFRLDGGEAPLPPAAVETPVPEPPPLRGSAQQLAKGKVEYDKRCEGCHGAFSGSISAYPNLAKMHLNTHKSFNDIVLGGLYSRNGMPSFGDALGIEEAEAIHAYLIGQQHRLWADKAKDGAGPLVR